MKHNRYIVRAGAHTVLNAKIRLDNAIACYMGAFEQASDCLVTLSMLDLTSGQERYLLTASAPRR